MLVTFKCNNVKSGKINWLIFQRFSYKIQKLPNRTVNLFSQRRLSHVLCLFEINSQLIFDRADINQISRWDVRCLTNKICHYCVQLLGTASNAKCMPNLFCSSLVTVANMRRCRKHHCLCCMLMTKFGSIITESDELCVSFVWWALLLWHHLYFLAYSFWCSQQIAVTIDK